MKIVKEIKFEGVLIDLELNKGLQRQSRTKYLRLAVVSCETAHYAIKLIAAFQECFASFNKIFISVEGLDTRLSF